MNWIEKLDYEERLDEYKEIVERRNGYNDFWNALFAVGAGLGLNAFLNGEYSWAVPTSLVATPLGLTMRVTSEMWERYYPFRNEDPLGSTMTSGREVRD